MTHSPKGVNQFTYYRIVAPTEKFRTKTRMREIEVSIPGSDIILVTL